MVSDFGRHLLKFVIMNKLQNILFPVVPIVDTSVKSMIEQGTPVAPVESQFLDQESPLHIFKSFDFKNMPKDPHALNNARRYTPPKPAEPTQPAAPVQTPVNSESVV